MAAFRRDVESDMHEVYVAARAKHADSHETLSETNDPLWRNLLARSLKNP